MSATTKRTHGFTILEMLVAVIIIVVLATITLVAYRGVQAKSRDAIRLKDIKHIQKIVELYHSEKGVYPSGGNGSNWAGLCASYGSTSTYVQGVSNYLPTQPVDPRWKNPADNRCYLYRTTGTEYIILAWNSMESICGGDPSNACNRQEMRDHDRACCTELSIAVYSPGAQLW
jgi:prepilin-type N-terminal cleavage/methylation domain-containing protein